MTSLLLFALTVLATLSAYNVPVGAQQTIAEFTRDSSGRVSVKFERGSKITLGNRTTGPIVVIGWDRDTVEATAFSERGTEAVRARIDPGESGSRIWLKADYASERPDPWFSQPSVKADVPVPALPPIAPPETSSSTSPSSVIRRLRSQHPTLSFRPDDILLEVRVPRYAEIEPIQVFRSEVLVTGVETAVIVNGEKSTIRLQKVGSTEVRTSSGDVEIDGVSGLADVITTSGAIVVKNAGADVRALSLSGRIEIECANGRVDVSNTDGPITISGISGDVSATTTYSTTRLHGSIRANGRYYLKSMSGAIEMELPANSPGFTATLSSYRGDINTDFSLKTNQPKSNTPTNRRLIGRHGNGLAQITLDSFDGPVKLRKLTPGATKDCRQ
jgi:hypothetical protein